jgi:hypothetical protein
MRPHAAALLGKSRQPQRPPDTRSSARDDPAHPPSQNSASASAKLHTDVACGDDGKPFEALPTLFERLGDSSWAVYRFLVQHHPELDGMTGREAVMRGFSARAVEVAESIACAAFS